MADTALPERTRARALTTVLVLVAVAPFLQSLTFGYVFDDTYAILGNASLRGWSSIGRVWLEQFGGDGGPFFGLYRPVTMTLFAILFNAGAKWPLWFHIAALALHGGAAVLVWRLLRHTLGTWPAYIAALWFAVHPVHVEAVANVTNASEVLVTVWTVLLALYLLQRRAMQESWREAIIAAALYLAAMLTKESGAMAAPVAALVVWGWHRDPLTVAQLSKRWWRTAVACAFAVVVVAVTRAIVLGGPVTGQPIAALGIAGMTGAERVVAMISLVPRVAELLVWPQGINPHYGPSAFPTQRTAYAALGALMIVGALAACMLRRPDRRPLAAFAILLVSFLPASNLLVPTGQVLAERTLYLPSVGAPMLVGLALEGILGWAKQRGDAARWTNLGAAAVGIVLVLFAARSARWTDHWRNHEKLFARMIAADSSGYAGYWLAGVEATRRSRPDEGLALFEKAYSLEKRDRNLVLDFGAALTNDRQHERAARVYRDALAFAPQDSTLNARLQALPNR